MSQLDRKKRWKRQVGARQQRVCPSKYTAIENNLSAFNFDTTCGILILTFTLHSILWNNELQNTSNAGTCFNLHVLLPQPEHNNFTFNSTQGRAGLSFCMCNHFIIYPSFPQCVFVTVIQAWRHFVSTVGARPPLLTNASMACSTTALLLYWTNIFIHLVIYHWNLCIF